MLRITIISSADGAVHLHLSGRIGSAEVGVLQVQLQQQAGRPQVLDLAAVQFIDEAGICLLERWVGRGLELRGGSVFIRRLLEERGLLDSALPSPS